MNNTINRKNRIVKGFRGKEYIFIPHSTIIFFSLDFFIDSLNNIGINNSLIIIVVISNI